MIVDVHHHYLPKRFFDDGDALLPADIEAVWNNGRVAYRERQSGFFISPPMDPLCWHDEEIQLRGMDAAGIDHAVLSAACYQDWMTMPAARLINDETASMIARHPDRFSAMISVPPDGGQEMVREIERARDLGLCAINMTTTHRGRYPDHPDFRLMFETAAALKLPVYVHPSWRTPLPNMDRWNLERAIGKPTDLNIGIANMMFSGTFADLPDLQMLFAHLGGSFPVTLRRMFYGPPGWLKVPDYDYPTLLKRLFVDTGPSFWWSPVDIECAARVIGADQLLLGSDYPLSDDPANALKIAVANVRGTDLDDSDKEKIFSKNAIKLFGLRRLIDAAAPPAGHLHAAGGGCC